MSYNCEILADSKNEFGDRLTTMKITFPRFILAEAKTHRIISGLGNQVEVTESLGINDDFNLSRNSASSRAIPFKKMVKMVEENPFIPIAWQKDHKGMQGTEYITDEIYISNCKSEWLGAKQRAINSAKDLSLEKVTKQLCNRLLEPFMWHTVIVTATEWENFFKLRCPQYYGKYRSWKDASNLGGATYETPFIFRDNDSQADIHIQAIAELMWDAYNESEPKQLKASEWHIPFGDNIDEDELIMLGFEEYRKGNTSPFYTKQVQDDLHNKLKIKIAVARCARISYQTLGDSPKIDYEADLRLYDILSKSEHWSPFEHVAKAMDRNEQIDYNGWCRNFKGFIQQRSLID